MSHLFIVGFMGAGKSTVGRLMADALQMPFIDADERIEAAEGRSIPEIFAEDGEEHFRALESEILASMAEEPDSVVACGGGVILADANRSLLKKLGSVVYLCVSAGEALARIGTGADRPLLADGGTTMAKQLLQARTTLYEATADYTVDTTGLGPEEVAQRAVEAVTA